MNLYLDLSACGPHVSTPTTPFRGGRTAHEARTRGTRGLLGLVRSVMRQGGQVMYRRFITSRLAAFCTYITRTN
jgi:hypothetical protein